MKITRVVDVMTGAWLILALGLGASFSSAEAAAKGETGDSEPAAKETGESTFARKKVEYRKEIAAKLREMHRELKDWKTKAEKMERKTREEVKKQLNDLSRKKAEIYKKLKDLKFKPRKAWEEFKTGMDSAMESLKKAFDEMRDRFKSN